MWHTHHGRPPIPSRDSTWLSSTRHSPFKTIQEGQYTSDPPETSWAPRKTKRTVWQSPQSQRSAPLKVREQVQFFHNKQGTSPIKWMTGTVTETLKCGCSYMIQAPNGRVYRRNRAHLKPMCHDSSSFQDHLVNKGKKQPRDNSFQDHQTSQARLVSFDNEVSYIDNEVSYMDTWSMMFDKPETCQAPPRSPSCSPPALSPLGIAHLGHHHTHPQQSFPSRESSVKPSSEDSLPEGRKRHQSEPAFIRPQDIDQGLTHGLSALLAETSPLTPYRLQWQAKAKAQEKITTHKWLLSRSFGSFQDHLVYMTRSDSFQDHLRCTQWLIDLHGHSA